jgi:hypothetical protein
MNIDHGVRNSIYRTGRAAQRQPRSRTSDIRTCECLSYSTTSLDLRQKRISGRPIHLFLPACDIDDIAPHQMLAIDGAGVSALVTTSTNETSI